MIHRRITDWEDAYANGANIARGDTYVAMWAQAGSAYRDLMGKEKRARIDIAYGDHPRNRLDLFLPRENPRGLVVYIHGGYWHLFDKSSWSQLARGANERGYAVAMPSYTLCPQIRISGIVREVGAAIGAAAAMVDGPIFLTGHSAGGHLASRMITTTSPLGSDVLARVHNTVSISGVHDLRPMMRMKMNAELQLDEAEAIAESPALLRPVEGKRITCWVGGGERAEFLRQNALLANVWTGLGAHTAAFEEPDRHHFSVVEGLADPEHALTRTLLEE